MLPLEKLFSSVPAGQAPNRSEAPPQTDEACEPFARGLACGAQKNPWHPAIRGKNPAVKHEELTGDIIGAAMPVLNELKPGLDEKLYENALLLELAARGHTVEQQREYPVHYRSHFIGKLVAGPAHQ